MKLLTRSMCSLMLCLFLLGSCIKSEYHWDNLNKEGVIDIPPLPIGSFKGIVIKDLSFWEIPEIEIPGLPSVTLEYADTLKNLFGDSSIKRFFHNYMDRDVSIEGDLEMRILGKDSGLKININFDALGADYDVLDSVHIKGLENVGYGKQHLAIVIPKEDGPVMKRAEHLQIRISFKTPESITLTDGDSIKLSNMIIKTAGYFVDL